MAQKIKYVIKYKLDGKQLFEFAELENGTEEEAKAALEKMHTNEEVSDIKVSKAL
ncbi:hypothetical protein JRG42_11485 [Pseudomonas granadensis]|uniref:Phage protein n=1 Tax=Pseudomonas granadensis TaxID=1421430 RepID=A0ABX7GPA6_9PSED|nr:hypothetical protein [Pseudomonas granadensis]MBN6774407.1 hypothetical protein [Pseudomonas granadensis]MBN6805119.1 hypothetical protein [Pseudomonas granadensis]MBN6832433.1 hypothetical protein [Pseudomonas granadensis]MBN6839313.1 hypothetical protein [Pseudomonas granadensis]MBN6868856.1 hypothetical protein [Pseudomonas granadensis]